jgi:hypothetical protein
LIDITVNGVDYEVPSSAADTNWAANQVAFEQALAEAVNDALEAAADAPTWIAPTLINSWVNYAGGTVAAGYYKDAQGTVHLRGAIKSGLDPNNCMQLPAGYRPTASETFLVSCDGGLANISIATSGNVGVETVTGDATVICWLSGINFSTV